MMSWCDVKRQTYRRRTLDGDADLSTDARRHAVGRDTLVDVVTVARHVLYHDHLAHQTDPCTQPYN